MKAIHIGVCLITLSIGAVLVGCCRSAAGEARADSPAATAVRAANQPLRSERLTSSSSESSSEATHCRIGHSFRVDPNDNSTVSTKLVWDIRTATAADFASAANSDFEVVLSNYNHTIAAALPFKIDPKDTFINSVSGDIITVDYTNIPASPDKNFVTTLTMQPAAAPHLWAEGSVSWPGVTGGTVVMFLRPDAQVCGHRNRRTTTQQCRRVLIEYFHTGDSLVVPDRPALGQNIFPITDPACSDGTQETSDGDGHEGPP